MASDKPSSGGLAGFLPGQWPVEAYGSGGFRFAEMSHRGSILALPSGVRAWSAVFPADIGQESLATLFDEPAGSIDMLIVGTGASLALLSPVLREALRVRGIRADSMATGSAVSTYNILLGERRRVAGAFLATA